MTKITEIQKVRLEEVEGFRHADDDYWYRPLIFSKNLFTYVAHIPPNGEMPAHEDAHEFDTSLFMLEGSLQITYGKEVFPISKHEALYVRGGVPFGVKNEGSETETSQMRYRVKSS